MFEDCPNELRMVDLVAMYFRLYQPIWSYYWRKSDVVAYCEKEFPKVGRQARVPCPLSMHPGPLTVLASDNEDIVQRFIEEFEYHVDCNDGWAMANLQDFKCNVPYSVPKGPAVLNTQLTNDYP